jgi:hypothetical protein
MIGELYYGGKVSDQNDQKLLRTILNHFLNSEVK